MNSPTTRPIRFFHRGATVSVHGAHPTRSVLCWLREDARCVGTKEGCNEGECGACTVVVGELAAPGDANAVRGLQMVGDSVRLRQILINLIGNAIKFTPAGRVAVVTRRTGEGETEQLRIDVQDSGIGISPENFSLIFERFKQADSSVSRKYGGTGLGLPISLRLARLMGGDIMVESKPAEGSLFTLIIPLRLSEPAPLPDSEPDVEIETGRPPDIRQKRVLIVDDYEGNIVVLSYLLDGMKCPYDISRTGKEGLDKWVETPL